MIIIKVIKSKYDSDKYMISYNDYYVLTPITCRQC